MQTRDCQKCPRNAPKPNQDDLAGFLPVLRASPPCISAPAPVSSFEDAPGERSADGAGRTGALQGKPFLLLQHCGEHSAAAQELAPGWALPAGWQPALGMLRSFGPALN